MGGIGGLSPSQPRRQLRPMSSIEVSQIAADFANELNTLSTATAPNEFSETVTIHEPKDVPGSPTFRHKSNRFSRMFRSSKRSSTREKGSTKGKGPVDQAKLDAASKPSSPLSAGTVGAGQNDSPMSVRRLVADCVPTEGEAAEPLPPQITTGVAEGQAVFIPKFMLHDDALPDGCNASCYAQRVGFNKAKLSKATKAFNIRHRNWFLTMLQANSENTSLSRSLVMMKHETGPDEKSAKGKWKNYGILHIGAYLVLQDMSPKKAIPEPLVLAEHPQNVAVDKKKRGANIIKVKTRNLGTFAFKARKDEGAAAKMIEGIHARLSAPGPTMLASATGAGLECLGDIVNLQDVPEAPHSQKVKVLMLGLTGVGKSSLISCLRTGEMDGLKMYKSQSVAVDLKLNDLYNFTITEVRGANPKVWPAYYLPNRERPAPYCVIYVLDAKNPSTLSAAAAELDTLLRVSQLKDTLFIVVANKSEEGVRLPRRFVAICLPFFVLQTACLFVTRVPPSFFP